MPASVVRANFNVFRKSTVVTEYHKIKITVPVTLWQVKAHSIRMLNRTKKEQGPEKALLDAQPEEVLF